MRSIGCGRSADLEGFMRIRASRSFPVLAPLALGLLVGCNSDGSTDPTPTAGSSSPALAVDASGNGAPSGAHYSLNIIGVAKSKNPDMGGAGGDVIFVNLGTKDGAPVTTRILLDQSAGEFAVLDKNGTDGEARFSLPAPGGYTVWARALGTPGGHAKITTCATDVTGIVADGDICSTQNEVFVRGTGKSSFRNVTTALTTIELDALADADAVTACGGTTVGLFDPCLQGYFWQYDNNGLKLLQVRFYQNPA
jgi:hypothetical protein